MPTPITHAVVGAALAQGVPAGVSKWRLAVVFGLLAALPDVDFIAFGFGIPYDHPLGHRGLSHSIFFALVVGGVASLVCRRFIGCDVRGLARVAPLTMLALATHGLLDAATNGGLGAGFFVPFSEHRFFFPVRPIIVSPFNPHSFVDRAARIFESEIAWVWMPVLAFSLAFHAVRVTVARTSDILDR